MGCFDKVEAPCPNCEAAIQRAEKAEESLDVLDSLLMRVSLCGGGVLIRGGDAKRWWSEVKAAVKAKKNQP